MGVQGHPMIAAEHKKRPSVHGGFSRFRNIVNHSEFMIFFYKNEGNETQQMTRGAGAFASLCPGKGRRVNRRERLHGPYVPK